MRYVLLRKLVLFLFIFVLIECCSDNKKLEDLNVGFYLILDYNGDCTDLALLPGTRIIEFRDLQDRVEYLLIKSKPELTDREFMTGRIDFDLLNRPRIYIKLKEEAGEKFRHFTENNLNRRVAIIKDNRVISVTLIKDKIDDGECVIAGKLSIDEAKKIVSFFQ